MPKITFDEGVTFIDGSYLKEGRFSFIEDSDLQESISVNAQYISFLFLLEKSYEMTGAISYSVFKTIIIYSASIVEALLLYKLKKLIDEGVTTKSKVLNKVDGEKKLKEVYEFNDLEEFKGKKIVCGIRERRFPEWKDLGFNDINRAAKRAKLLEEDVFERVDQLREMRNEIHITDSKLKENEEPFFTEENVQKVFSLLGEVIEIVKV